MRAPDNSRAHHAFDHAGFVYVLDFNKMLCWIIDPEDSDITALGLNRRYPSKWYWKPCDVPAMPFQEDLDSSWTEKVEKKYKDYVNQLVVSRKKPKSKLQENLESKQ